MITKLLFFRFVRTSPEMGADQSKQLENTLFNLKFSAKSLVRESKKCEKAEKEEKTKLKKAIQKGNTEGARIYAENAIRNKNQVRLRFFSVSSKFTKITIFVGYQLLTIIITSGRSCLEGSNGSFNAACYKRYDTSCAIDGICFEIYEFGTDLDHAGSF